ncbi:5123_t:CDS:1, partial [Racocetra persica]
MKYINKKKNKQQAIRSLQDAMTDQKQNDSINQSSEQRTINLGTNTRVLSQDSESELESEEETKNKPMISIINVQNLFKVA